MATWIRRRPDAVTVHYISVVRWAVGLTICAALLVQVIFELAQRPIARGDWLAMLWWAGAVLFITALVSPWTRLRVDRARRLIDWRRLSLAPSRLRMPFEDVEKIAAGARPTLGFFARYVIRLRGAGWSIDVPLGWSAARAMRHRAEALAAYVDRALTATEDSVLDELPLEQPAPHGRRVSLRRLLVAVTLAAAVLGLARLPRYSSPEGELTTSILSAVIVAAVVILFRAGEAATERFLVLLVAIYGPFVWIVSLSRPWGYTSGLYEIALAMPGAAGAVIMRISGFDDSMQLLAFVLFNLGELAIAAWLAFRGWWATMIYAVVIGILSTLTSLLLYAMART